MPKSVPVSKKKLPPLTDADKKAIRAAEKTAHVEKVENKKRKRLIDYRDRTENLVSKLEDLADTADRLRAATDAKIFGTPVPNPNGAGFWREPDGLVQAVADRKADLRHAESEGDDSLIDAARKRLERAEEAVRRAKAEWSPTGADEFLKQTRRAIRRNLDTRCEPMTLPAADGDQRALAALYAKDEKFKAERIKIKDANRAKAEAIERGKNALAALAAEGRKKLGIDSLTDPDGNGKLEFGGEFQRDEITNQLVEVPALGPFLAALDPKNLERLVMEKINSRYANSNDAITSEERTARLAKIKTERMALHYQIEAEILALEAKGVTIYRRPGLSIWAMLKLKPLGKDRSERERESGGNSKLLR